jgi:hypothetical protein
LLAAVSDGKWYEYIPNAEQMEKEQWQLYEEQFRHYHEQSLPYRFLPESAEEYEIVVKAFPPVTFAASTGVLALDHEKMAFEQWPEQIRYEEITNLALDKNRVLKVSYQRQGKHVQSLKMSKFAQEQEVLNAIQHYYGRYLAAAAYQKQKQQEAGCADQADRQG